MAVTTSFESFSVGNPNPSRGPGSSFADVVALANGGWAVVSNAGGDSDIDIFNADGSDAGGASDLGGARGAIDQLTNGNIVVAFQDGDSVNFRVVDGTGATVAGNVDILDSDTSNADVAALGAGNQNFVLVYQDDFPSGDADVEVRIHAPDGSLVTAFAVDATSAVDTDAVVCALDDGGFAVAWVRTDGADTQLWTAVYNANGSVRRAPALADNIGTINRNADIAAVNGGFAVVYEDNGDATGTVDIALMVFSSAGVFQRRANVSDPTLGGDGSPDERPTLARLSNGFLAVGWENNAFPDTEHLIGFVDPATGERKFLTNIGAGQPLEDDVGEVALAVLADDRLVHFHTNLNNGDVDGEIGFQRRVSVGDGADDVITGDSLRDRMEGNGGNDTLAGRGGDDVLNGGTGSDTADYSGATGTGVTVNLGLGGPQSISASEGFDALTDIENVIGSNFADTLTGNGQINRLEGRGGADTYVVDSQSEVLVELATADADTVLTGLANYSLFAIANVERITFTGAGNFVGRGNGLDNRILGGVGNDRFVADQGGADRYFGDFGTTDTMDFRTSAIGAIVNLTTGIHGGAAAGDFFSSIEYFFGSDTAGDDFTGAGFNDRLDGYGGADVLRGLGGNDTIQGGNGDDVISGGALLDFLTGNAGADDFVYTNVSESGPTSGARDRILDFQAGSDDIDVFSIDASAAGGGNEAFTQFLGAGAFTAEGQVRWFQSGANTVIEFNTTGASGAEMQIQLQAFTAANLTAADFIG